MRQGVYFNSPSFTTSSLGPNDPKVGDTMQKDNDHYVFVYNAGNSQINPTYGCTVSAVSGYSVTVSAITGLDLCVGVCKHSTIATGYYGWLMTRGFCQVQLIAAGTAPSGTLLSIGIDGAFEGKTISTGYPTEAIGKTVGTIGSGASGTAYIVIY